MPDRPLYALYAPGGQTPTRVQLFLDFATDWFCRQARTQKAAPAATGQPETRSAGEPASRSG